ncbi:hypothetical protein [Devosia sp. LjRoot3]|uniref:hypothetical protein n=1 Tax=Devosia sp. LjRoot3 TaxID=3342319 RepID=UPI003ED01000
MSTDNPEKRPPRKDGRKALLSYLSAEAIERLKIEALRKNTPAYLILEKLILNNL